MNNNSIRDSPKNPASYLEEFKKFLSNYRETILNHENDCHEYNLLSNDDKPTLIKTENSNKIKHESNSGNDLSIQEGIISNDECINYSLNIMKQNIDTELIENIDVISIISTNSDTQTLKVNNEHIEEDSISYHSSDFEFIDEKEARSHGIYEKIESPRKIKDYFDQGPSVKYHEIPVGDDFFELFKGRYTPYPTMVMENKSTRSRNEMCVEYNGLGFNMHGPKQIVCDKLRNEALLSAHIIRQMYPQENRRRRRYIN